VLIKKLIFNAPIEILAILFKISNPIFFKRKPYAMKLALLPPGFLALLIFTAATLTAQRTSLQEDVYYKSNFTTEIGTSLGAMNCFTDLGGKRGAGSRSLGEINVPNTQLCGSIFFSEYYKNIVGLRMDFTWGVVKANDKVLAKRKEIAPGRYARNLSVRSAIFEMAAMAEFHPLYLLHKYDVKKQLQTISPYITTGIGFFTFNPTTRYNGQSVELQPLRTEGQGFTEYPDRKPYKLRQFNWPIGGGVKLKIIENVNMGAECVYRVLKTDYLDDVSTQYVEKRLFRKYLEPALVSTAEAVFDRRRELDPNAAPAVEGDIRGNPRKNDSYFSFTIRFGILF
jgi:hypothetical protein